MTILIADSETDNLLDKMTVLHMLQLGDADGDDCVIYADVTREQAQGVADRRILKSPIQPIAAGLERIAAADLTVWHNGTGFDYDAVNHFHPGALSLAKMLDTLVLARLAFPEERDHRLEAWGKRIGVLKDDYRGGYAEITDDFLAYSEQDVIVGRALFHKVKHVLQWGEASALEHTTARAIILQERNGFTLNVPGAEALAADLRGELDELTKGLVAVFPPLRRSVDFIPKRDNKTRGLKAGVNAPKVTMEAFNPNSRRHCAERMKLAGWTPNEFNQDGTPTLNEKILSELPYPEARHLQAFFTANKKLAQLSDGKEGWLKHVKPDGRVHGRVNPQGCVTGRMSHSKPNMGNVDADPRMRSLWGPRPGWVLVGCDAEGLEARVMASFLARWDGGAYGKMVLEGSSENRTDVHSSNVKACVKLGLLPRAVWDTPASFKIARGYVKTLLYAMLYGAQDPKLGATFTEMLKALGLRPPALAARERGALFRKALATSMVGLDKLAEAVRDRAKTRKYLVGFDGRHVPVRSIHAALNTLCQGGGAVVMKKALCLFLEALAARGYTHGTDFGLVANVHDEFQTECRPEIAEEVRQLAEDSIRLAGEHFSLRCPLAGKASVGANWSLTH